MNGLDKISFPLAQASALRANLNTALQNKLSQGKSIHFIFNHSIHFETILKSKEYLKP